MSIRSDTFSSAFDDDVAYSDARITRLLVTPDGTPWIIAFDGVCDDEPWFAYPADNSRPHRAGLVALYATTEADVLAQARAYSPTTTDEGKR